MNTSPQEHTSPRTYLHNRVITMSRDLYYIFKQVNSFYVNTILSTSPHIPDRVIHGTALPLDVVHVTSSSSSLSPSGDHTVCPHCTGALMRTALRDHGASHAG